MFETANMSLFHIRSQRGGRIHICRLEPHWKAVFTSPCCLLSPVLTNMVKLQTAQFKSGSKRLSKDYLEL